jgi:hypothetical protein
MKSKALATAIFAALSASAFSPGSARAVTLYSSDADPGPARNLSPPTGDLANSGEQYEGVIGSALATPIAPNYFVTATHIGNVVGDTMAFDGTTYYIDSATSDPSADLTIGHVTTAFPTYAPLYTSTDEVGKSFVVYGLGVDRGDPITVDGAQKGWAFGTADYQESWGTDTVASINTDYSSLGPLLVFPFNPTTINSCELAPYDSGGGLFINNAGTWELAGVNYGIDGLFSYDASGDSPFDASLYDTSGLYEQNPDNTYSPAPDAPANSYDTAISQNLAFIDSVVPEPGSVSLLTVAAGSFLLKRRPRTCRPS